MVISYESIFLRIIRPFEFLLRIYVEADLKEISISCMDFFLKGKRRGFGFQKVEARALDLQTYWSSEKGFSIKNTFYPSVSLRREQRGQQMLLLPQAPDSRHLCLTFGYV